MKHTPVISSLKIGDKVKLFGFGLVDGGGRISALFDGESGVIEKIEDIYMAEIRMDSGGELARLHLIQVIPKENLS